MKKHSRTFSALVLLTLLIAACTSPAVGGTPLSSSDQVATVVVKTLQALTPLTPEGETGQAEMVYVDGRPNVTLTSLAQQMRWGP